jgi:uncharacterized protein (TIGR03086 family)
VRPLNGDQRLLRAAVSYAVTAAALATPPLLSSPTPCADWDLLTLLDHVGDSMAALCEAMATSVIAASPQASFDTAPSSAGPVGRLRRQAASLLDASLIPWSPGGSVAIGDLVLSPRLVAVTGSLEIAVHGWDIHAACGVRRPVPPRLASALLPIAPLLIPTGTRDGLFGSPVKPPPKASPGDQLIAFLGRKPDFAATQGAVN